jgi:hypothetical protein
MTDTSPRSRKLNLDTIASLSTTKSEETNPGLVEVQRYLRSFGYLRRGAYTADQLDPSTSEALHKYQERHDLAPTGVFDEPTREQMLKPRCAMPDMRNGVAFATTCAWDRRSLTFALDTGTNDVAGGGEFNAVRAAFATWAAAAPLTFTEVTTAQNPDIRIGWRPANDPDHSMVGGTLAHADFPPGCSVVTNNLPKPVHFDDQEHNWSIGSLAGAFDVESVALHEIGHIIGLGHSNVPGAVMFPSISPGATNRSLTPDDSAGAQGLYLPVVGPTPYVACAVSLVDAGVGAKDDLHVLALSWESTLWHTIREAPFGKWPFPFGDVQGQTSQTGPHIGPVNQTACAVDNQADLHVLALDENGSLWHTIRRSSNGHWSALGDVQGQTSQTGPHLGPVRQTSCAADFEGMLHVLTVDQNDRLWHTLRHPDGSWPYPFGDVQAIVPGQ